MLPLTGYTDRLSARPGERIAFKISSVGPDPVEAALVRIVCGDPNPAGPGLQFVDHSQVYAGRHPSTPQTAHPGSYATIDGSATPWPGTATLEALVWSTVPGEGEQIVLSTLDPTTGLGVAIGVGADGGALAVVGTGAGAPVRLTTARPMPRRRWCRLRASYEAASGRLMVGFVELSPPFGHDDGAVAEGSAPGAGGWSSVWRMAVLGLEGRAPVGQFSGKIEAPRIYAGAPASGRFLEAETGLKPIAAWDFSRDISSMTIRDVGPNGLDGRLVNMPARGMIGSLWTGREHCWRHAPEQYAAIHFHATDLADCEWPTTFEFDVPADLRSGVYGMRLTCGAHSDVIPFFVPAPKGRRGADLCVLMSTFTYVVYTNFDRPDFDQSYRDRAAALGMSAEFPADHPEYAFSTYNKHNDGSGVCHSSPLRPMMTMRPSYLNQVDLRGSGLRHFSADTHLLAWLHAKGLDYDIVTDHELDEEGVDAVKDYRALLTGSHPEYHTEASLDALLDYRNGGGRLCYLGGNGFYWRVARHPEKPEVIEIRRGEGGIRAWASEPGEYFNAFDGAYGGLWRRQGRAPQALAGVGFSSQGTFEGSYYRRAAGAADPRASWVLDGVEGDVIGDFGLSGGGAAGFELDRADVRLGTPEHALVLASSEGHSERFILVPEEMLTHLVTLPGESAQDLIRAELVFFETPAGGAVFSTGSITFCGSLPHNGCQNPVSTLLENVVRRFLDPTPFRPPA